MIPLPPVPAAVPRTHGPLVAGFGRWMLTLAGWKIEGKFPDAPKMMLILAPHTSNWDFPVGLMAKFALRLECRFMAKASLYRWPRGAGVPVVLVVFDYGRKVVRLGPAFDTTENYDGDLAKMQSHITAAMAKHPARYRQG